MKKISLLVSLLLLVPSFCSAAQIAVPGQNAPASAWLTWFKTGKKNPGKIARARNYLKNKANCMLRGKGCSAGERNKLRALGAAIGVAVGGAVFGGVAARRPNIKRVDTYVAGFLVEGPSYDLFKAIELGHKGVKGVRQAIDAGADVNALLDDTFSKQTPLHKAAYPEKGFPSPKVIKLLLKKGADAKAFDAYGNPPFHYAQSHTEVRAMLEKAFFHRTSS